MSNLVAGASSPREARVLVLGYGNPGRQDDGLGPAAVAAIEGMRLPNLTAFDDYQLNIEDAADVAMHDIVWFIDAARTGPAPYAVHAVSPSSTIEFTSHILRPEAVLAIARQYYRASPQAFLLAIRGYEFEFTEELTPRAKENLSAALAMLTGRFRAAQAQAQEMSREAL
jgi:hydrogenase maturation protease